MPGQKRKRTAPKEDVRDGNDDDGFISPDISEDSDSGEEGERHERLLASLAALQKSRKKKVERSHVISTSSEFPSAKILGDNAVAERVGKSNDLSKIPKKLNKGLLGSKKVKAPLTKPQKERAERSAAYDIASEEISKWQPLVKKNREAKQLDLRDEHAYSMPKSVGQFLHDNFKPRDEFETEMLEVMKDPTLSNKIGKDGLTLTERRELDAMTIEEAKERRAELQKNRALQSYYERKCARQNKIKSKSYHRVKRKEREARAERAKERGTLKHQNTSKWAKNLKIRGHKDATTRQLLSDDLRRGSELVQKDPENEEEVNTDTDGDAVEDEDMVETVHVEDNVHSRNGQDSDDALVHEEARVHKSLTTRHKQPNLSSAGELMKADSADEEDDAEESDSHDDDDGTEEDDEDDEDEAEEEDDDGDDDNNQAGKKVDDDGDEQRVQFVGDVDMLLEAGAGAADVLAGEQQCNIAESFAAGDVQAAFAVKKAEEVEASKPKVVDDFLPGWGDWAGDGVQLSKKAKRRKRRFVNHQKPGPNGEPRADRKLPHVIISDKRHKNLEKHQVKNLPFPFTSKAQYQQSLRMPVGREWHTEQSFRDLCQPKVLTNMGAIIEPIKAPKAMTRKIKA
ncbi:U3 small nucleolar RNA-associated protein 14 homolog A-like [Sycon ciliatum]|uniref:U3 small nucleolar RNA-associated protein 14 homolog A-like n=1 Tax=Sycon ciliatum TaxID=27933 RepID=UPI0020ADEB5F|eukprot:scpid54555/ scgid15779/ U3 small nucleolar RNA-associated protein 14 homolog C